MGNRTETIKIIIAAFVSFSLFSCAISKAIYLGADNHSSGAGVYYPDEYAAENINGSFPKAVYIKTRTQTFNLYHYYIIHEGLIWYKSIDPEKEPGDWELFMKTGLPHAGKSGFNQTNKIAEISADADELVALSADGYFYRYCFDKTIAHRSNAWLDRQGWPVEEQIFFDERTSKNRSWAVGKRNHHVLYYEDIFGNQHHNGTMEIATTYVLLQDGQEICYGDPGVPSDFSRNYSGPERGAFIAVSLSASASTMFVINEAGEMYTRLADFDTIGCDPMWFKYTYVPYTSDLPGTDYFSNLNEWALPSEGWRSQPRIPLAGKAVFTRHITILQNGHGNGARELRVAGLNNEGQTGYWKKQIFHDTWEFADAPLFFAEDAVLATAETFDAHPGRRGLSPDKSYTGFRWNGNEKEHGWEYQIPNFNMLEGDCDFLVTWQGETCTFRLHPVEMWTYLKRDYLPGRTGSPKLFLATLEIPENAFESLSDACVRQLAGQFAQYDKTLFSYTIAASSNYIVMRNSSNARSLLFLTDGTISSHYSELHIGRYIENYGEVQRYYAPELTISTDAGFTAEGLTGKTALNRQFVDELKYKIRELKWSQFTAFQFSAGYIPAHYIAKITPLRFVDVPKIRTITSFGEKLILANSAYINTITNSRIRIYEKIIEMLKARILCYSDMEKKLSGASGADYPQGNSIPPWYSDHISDYWDIAGLPRTISGTFFAYGADSVPIPAVISFVPPQSEYNISGWFLAIGESGDFSVFLESHNIAQTIYSRKGKTPQEKKLRLDGTLHINDGNNAPEEQDIIERCLRPYLMGIHDSINVRIACDGKNFEIREYPAKHSETVIFRGSF